ncbi:putative integral membrane protein (TIGR00698 family) [Actinopolyspora biskrensis]|uniref:Putative integral membrane protein (TIGR00698 family) n=2 Tax=Actinopolyspora biskrensis TaxID=1470178 RepID=A0A852Z3G5_9ACTN|nr:putative integral membrane protein (TIGR00698 family) [Actinopolyspora biskrensis]
MRTMSVGFRNAAARAFPGTVLAGAATAVALAVSALLPGLGALTVAVLCGLVVGNVFRLSAGLRLGLARVLRVALRLGVVLLGLRLAAGELLSLGAGTLVAVLLVVLVTFFGTVLLAGALGTSGGLGMLVATGFAVCGASAIAAMESVVDREDEDVATAVAMVTLYGTAAMVALPLVGDALGLSAPALGRIAGGSVHEVGQVVAAASPAGSAAVAVAVTVKLARVVLLAPLVTAVGLVRRSRSGAQGATKPPLIPLFVLGFLFAVLVRSCGVLPEPVLDGARQLTTVLLTGALFALGTSVRLSELIRTGPRALLLGLGSTALVTITTVAAMAALT